MCLGCSYQCAFVTAVQLQISSTQLCMELSAFSALSFCLAEHSQSISLVLAAIINRGCYNGGLEAVLLVLLPKGSEVM